MLLAGLGRGLASRLPPAAQRCGADALPRLGPPSSAFPSLSGRGAAAARLPGLWTARVAHRGSRCYSHNHHHHHHHHHHQYYAPPSGIVYTSRLKTNIIVYGVIGANAVVFYWWYLAKKEGPHQSPWSVNWSRTTEKLDWMNDNFVMSARNIQEGRWWTLLTAAFSHYDAVHILVNMMVFHFSATAALRMGFGAARLAYLSLGSALTASAAALLNEQTSSHPMKSQGGLGASGMVEGILAAVACTAPRAQIRLLIPPVPMPLGVFFAGYLGWDVWRMYQTRRHGESKDWKGDIVGYSAHLGGAFFGITYWLVRIRPAFRGVRFQ